MIRFFSTIEQLEHFVRALQWQNNSDFICPHCSSSDQWFSHGFQYKQLSINSTIVTGKRLICSRRYAHTGCGHTVRLYLSERLPQLQHGCAQLFIFIVSLLLNNACGRCSVEQAYRLATGANNTRHAWRWLGKLRSQLPVFRSLFFNRPAALDDTTCIGSTGTTHHAEHTYRLLQSSLSQLSQQLACDTNTHNLCSLFQLKIQNRFI